jgi:RNA polymerase sigma-70 factor (ECF subfamily)
MDPGSFERNPIAAETAAKLEGPTDARLVEDAIKGRSTAFDELIRRYQKQAVAVSYRLLGNSNDALEVTQDAFLKAFASIRTIQKPAAFGGWLMRIVSNLSLNYRRSRKNQSQLPLDDILSGSETGQSKSGGAIDPVHQLESRDMGQRLQAALKSLPEKQQLAIVMFAIEQMPQAAVAEAMECSVEAVKWHVFQGRKKLKELLREDLED